MQKTQFKVFPLEGELASECETEELGIGGWRQGGYTFCPLQQDSSHLLCTFGDSFSPAGSVTVWLSMSTGHRFTTKPRFAPFAQGGLLVVCVPYFSFIHTSSRPLLSDEAGCFLPIYYFSSLSRFRMGRVALPSPLT